MNANAIINMIIRQVTRRLVNKGVNAGIDLATRRGKSDGDMTVADKERAAQGKDLAKRARQAGRITRKMF